MGVNYNFARRQRVQIIPPYLNEVIIKLYTTPLEFQTPKQHFTKYFFAKARMKMPLSPPMIPGSVIPLAKKGNHLEEGPMGVGYGLGLRKPTRHLVL